MTDTNNDDIVISESEDSGQEQPQDMNNQEKAKEIVNRPIANREEIVARIEEVKDLAEAMTLAGEQVPDDLKEKFKYLEKMLVAYDKTNWNPSIVSHAASTLYLFEPFLGTVSIGIAKRVDWNQPTAYVGVRQTNAGHDLVMGYNPSFLCGLTQEQIVGVFRHEIYHVVFQHIFTRHVADRRLQRLHNWATDLAINSLIGPESLPSFGLLPGRQILDHMTRQPVNGPYEDFVRDTQKLQSSDWYFSELIKIMNENNHTDESQITIGGGDGSMDSHDQWDNIPEAVREEIRERVNDLMEKGVIATQRSDKRWGTIPQEIQQWIERYLSREVDWRSVVKQFFGRVRSTDRTSSLKRINKKMPYIAPGVKRKTMAKFAVFVDQSGSVADEELKQFFGEIASFSKETEIDCYHFDTAVDESSHTVWKKGRTPATTLRTRCGGTDFNAVADFCNSKRDGSGWSGVVILTDGYAPTMGAIRGAKVLWVITPSGTLDAVRSGDLVVKMGTGERGFRKF